MNALTLPFRVVARRGARSLLAIVGVALAVAGFVAIVGLTGGVEASLETGLGESGGDLIVSANDTFNLRDSNLPMQIGPALAAVPGVTDVAPMLFNLVTIDDSASMIVTGWPRGGQIWRGLSLAAGRAPAADEQFAAVLGEGAASALKKHVGDRIEIFFRPFTIVGIARFETVFNQNGAFVPLPVLQDLLGRPDRVTMFQVRLAGGRNVASLADIKSALKIASGGLAVHESAEIARDIRFLDIIRSLSRAIALVVLSLSVLGVANTLLMSVMERTAEFGVLSAIGWRPRHIVFIVAAEGLLLSTVGGALGVGLGYIAMAGAARLPFAIGFLQPYITWPIALKALGASIAVGVLGAAYPALRAARLWPAEAMRGPGR